MELTMVERQIHPRTDNNIVVGGKFPIVCQCLIVDLPESAVAEMLVLASGTLYHTCSFYNTIVIKYTVGAGAAVLRSAMMCQHDRGVRATLPETAVGDE